MQPYKNKASNNKLHLNNVNSPKCEVINKVEIPGGLASSKRGNKDLLEKIYSD